ncbi:LppU/SCO3897 family protein [Streptomyces sp. NPDC055005]
MATPPPQQGSVPQHRHNPYAQPPGHGNPYAQPPQQQPAVHGNPYAQPQPGAGAPQPGAGAPQPAGHGNPFAAGVPGQGAPLPHPGHQAPQQGGHGCRLCGAQPAAQATVRGHQGMVLMMRSLSVQGPFCRDCGTATVRDMSAKTLWQGWWGPMSLLLTPITVLRNLGPRSTFAKLAAPQGGFRAPLDPGRQLRRRPQALVVSVPMALALLFYATLIVIAVAGS